MDGVAFLLNVVVGVWLLLTLACLACWYIHPFGRYVDRTQKYWVIATIVILALMTLMRYVRMEE